MNHTAHFAALVIFTATTLAFGASSGEHHWALEADVDWDAMIERVQYTPELPGNEVYPWRAYRFTAQPVPRVQTGLENLRETVYWKGERVLDEGYWYGEQYSTPKQYETLYNTKETYEDPSGDIITRWESAAVTLTRQVTLSHDIALFRYRIRLKPIDETDEAPTGDVCMAVLFHADPESGTTESSMAYIIKRVNDFSVHCTGITNRNLSFSLRYTFDDSMKALHDFHIINSVDVPAAVLGWDGMNPPDYYNEGIEYNDAKFRPSTPAIMAMVHKSIPVSTQPDPADPAVSLKVETGHLDEHGQWQGLPPHGRYTQMATAVYRSHLSPVQQFIRGDANLDLHVDLSDAITLLGYLFGGLPLECLDAADANDSGSINISDPVYLLNYLFGGGSPPPPPYPERGPDPTLDLLDCQFYPAGPIVQPE